MSHKPRELHLAALSGTAGHVLVRVEAAACRSSRPEKERPMATVSVRYFVRDIDAAIDFYCQLLDFHVAMHPNASFAMLSRGDLRLVLSVPGGGRVVARRRLTAGFPNRAAGTASSSRLLISPPPWRRCAPGERTSAATSSSASASTRSWSTTPPATRSRSTSRRSPRRDRRRPQPYRRRVERAVALRVARRACTRLDLELLGQRPGLGAATSPTRAPCPARRALPAAPRCDP